MSCVQATCFKPFIYTNNKVNSPLTYGPHSRQCHVPTRVHRSLHPSMQLSTKRFACKQSSPLLKDHLSLPGLKFQKLTPLSLFGDTGKSEGDGEGSVWKSLEKAMGSFRKENSIQDVLRQQMEKQEPYDDYEDYDDDGNFGGKPPRGGGGGGGGDLGGSKDEGFAGIMDELLQVVLATMCLVTMYIHIVFGDELFLLIRDIIKYLCRGGMSDRLLKLLAKKRCKIRVGEEDPYWLERAIISTPTWWDRPWKYSNRKLKINRASQDDDDSQYYDEL